MHIFCGRDIRRTMWHGLWLAVCVSASGVRVKVVAPAYFDTGRVRKAIEDLMVSEGLDQATHLCATSQAGTQAAARAELFARVGQFAVHKRLTGIPLPCPASAIREKRASQRFTT